MALNRAALERLRLLLGSTEAAHIESNATIAERIERTWLLKLEQLFASVINQTLDLSKHGELILPEDIEERLGVMFLQHEMATVTGALGTLRQPAHVDADPHVRAAKKKKPKLPRSAHAIREAWDNYRKTGNLPKHAAANAKKIKSLYIRKVQELWQKHGRDFIEGHARKPNGEWNPDAFDKEAARKAIQKATKVSVARARTVVETETTRYYNDARREYYDAIETVDGYLFVIVRDSGTTRWCLSRAGLVFFRGALLNKNTPPCHWNCRSEVLPLSRLNPTHAKILADEKLWATNNKLVPLPPGWNA